MKCLPLDATDEMLLAALKEFVMLLAEKQYDEASHFLFHPPAYDWYPRPEQIASVIQGILSEEEQITSPEEARGNPDAGVSRNEHDEGGSAWFSLPINGEWSDLMALFHILPIESFLVFCLQSIRVP